MLKFLNPSTYKGEKYWKVRSEMSDIGCVYVVELLQLPHSPYFYIMFLCCLITKAYL